MSSTIDQGLRTKIARIIQRWDDRFGGPEGPASEILAITAEAMAAIAESHAYCGCNGAHGTCLADDTPKAIAQEIRELAVR